MYIMKTIIKIIITTYENYNNKVIKYYKIIKEIKKINNNLAFIYKFV